MPLVYIGGGIVALALSWKALDELNQTAKWLAVGGVVYLGGKVLKAW